MTTAMLDSVTSQTDQFGIQRGWEPLGRTYDPILVAHVISKIGELSRLPANWDQYGAPPIHSDVVETALALADDVAWAKVAPRVVPMSSGSIQFEWREDDRELEIEIEPGRILHYLKWHPAAQIEEEGVFRASNTRKFAALLDWIFAEGR